MLDIVRDEDMQMYTDVCLLQVTNNQGTLYVHRSEVSVSILYA